MKQYIAPTLTIRKISDSRQIITSSPQIWDDVEADPEEPIQARQRDEDWTNFE